MDPSYADPSGVNPTVAPPAPEQGLRARRRAATKQPVAYDFRRPIQLSREHSRILQLGFDSFARQATTLFTSSLRRVCEVGLSSIDQRTYAEYIDSLDPMTYMTLFSVDPMPGVGMVELPLAATMSCVDHMLGGPGSATQPLRHLSDIEGAVMSGLVERLLGEMRYAMAQIVALEPRVTGKEYSPQFAQMAAASEVMVVTEFALRIGDQAHRMTLCLPFTGLLPHLAQAAAPAPASDRERAQRVRAAELLRASFDTVPVDVHARLRPTELGPDVLSALTVGDVVRLAHPSSAPIDVTVDGTVFAHATIGARGPRLAALIVGIPQEES
ncbi:flagellar motor switch protein FliM [Nocardioides sp. AE5]|uniref:flagellar motor switch protein FliM n=1 Tax=Nocardioides sp. AE5 TaxID=2962573 RepID=UPI002882B600|nr:flagellar motor switch protein FliM [Nocardioides sp. AE5]MDT0200790.1 flagellar motor switch protein FliM [Nocardioides sp. AE5]